jgi:hypothetical protein
VKACYLDFERLALEIAERCQVAMPIPEARLSE